MRGIHLIGELYGCDGKSPYLCEAATLQTLCLEHVDESGLTLLGAGFHQFHPSGVTGTVMLAESHLAIHTWPESGYVTLDVFVCNYTRDNSDKAHRLFEALGNVLAPQERNLTVLERGR